MSEMNKYYVLTVQSGMDIPHHDFEKAPDGTYLFTKDEAKAKVSSRSLEAFNPVAVPAMNLEVLMGQLKSEQVNE